MKIHHLDCGRMFPVAGGLLTPSGQMSCHCILIETADTLVLIDTGVGEADMKDPSRLGPMRWLLRLRRDPADTAVQQIERLGYRREDVGHIVITHLDLDHAGGLPDFPRAKVHVLRAEHEAAMRRRSFQERSRYRLCHWAHDPVWMIHERPCGEPWYGFDCLRRVDGLPEEIVLVPLPGHTAGHSGVAIQAAGGWLLHCGDLYYDRRQIAPPPRPPPLLELFQLMSQRDRSTVLETRRRIRELLRRHADEVRICCTHDLEELETLRA